MSARLIEAVDELPSSPARTRAPVRSPLRVGLVQENWDPDANVHERALAEGVRTAAARGAVLVCLPELTLSPYFAMGSGGPADAGVQPERIGDGPTTDFAARLAVETGAHVHASLYELADAPDGLGFNTAIVVDPAGEVVARTRKLHIPTTAGYHEDRYFRPGPAEDAFTTLAVGDARVGFPTCWDQWFGEVARAYSLAGADIVVYPTAIGSEPDHPDFDTQPLWERVIVANGIANGTFMVAVNRFGSESNGGTDITFYGSSFISDPYGRVLVQAPRDEAAVLVADLDLDQREDWLDLFPLLATRRPDAYGSLTAPLRGQTRGDR